MCIYVSAKEPSIQGTPMARRAAGFGRGSIASTGTWKSPSLVKIKSPIWQGANRTSLFWRVTLVFICSCSVQ